MAESDEDQEVESVMLCIPCKRELGGGWCVNCKYFANEPIQPEGSRRRRFQVKKFDKITYPRVVKSLFASALKAATKTPAAVSPSPAAAAATTAPAAPPLSSSNTARKRRLYAIPSSTSSRKDSLKTFSEDEEEAEQAAAATAATLVHHVAAPSRAKAAKKPKCTDIEDSPQTPVGLTVVNISLSPTHASDADATSKLPSSNANVPSSAKAAEPSDNAAPAESDLAPKAVTDDESEGEQEMPEGHDKPSIVELSISDVMSKSCKDIKNFVRNLHDQKGFEVKFKLLNIQKQTVDQCKQWLQQYSYHLKQARLGCWKTKLSCRDKVRA
jgi:hypothetical protein